MRWILLPLALIACNPTENSPKGQITSNDHTWTAKDRGFAFRLDIYCSTGQIKPDSAQADTAFKKAQSWRAWSEVGEDWLPGGKTFHDLQIKKGPHGWEPSCEHPWNKDSIGNVRSVVVWD